MLTCAQSELNRLECWGDIWDRAGKKIPIDGDGGGERGIRTLDTDLSPYASLAGKCLRPLGQLSVYFVLRFLRGRDTTLNASKNQR